MDPSPDDPAPRHPGEPPAPRRSGEPGQDGGRRPGPADEPSAPGTIEDVYDPAVVARIDAAGRTGPRRSGSRRAGLAGAVVAGAMVGLGEALEPERARPNLVEFVPTAPDEDGQFVTFHLVAGSPRASRLVVRPWLAPSRRRRHDRSAP